MFSQRWLLHAHFSGSRKVKCNARKYLCHPALSSQVHCPMPLRMQVPGTFPSPSSSLLRSTKKSWIQTPLRNTTACILQNAPSALAEKLRTLIAKMPPSAPKNAVASKSSATSPVGQGSPRGKSYTILNLLLGFFCKPSDTLA